tara:strand:- start:32592 stop:33584 length:993 start_codon:yes stop_codon:yes gene_type:complete
MPSLDFVAVADSGSGRARKKLPELVQYVESWEQLPGLNLDLISVATPPVEQRSIVLALMQRSVNVLCEKPFGSGFDDARSMEQAAAFANKLGVVAFQYRYEKGLQELRDSYQNGKIGGVRSISCSWLTNGRRDPSSLWSWRNDKDQGGGVIGAFLSHIVDLLQWITGQNVSSVEFANTEILYPNRPLFDGTLVPVTAEDRVETRLILGAGIPADCEVSNCHTHSIGMQLIIRGEKGNLVYTHSPPFCPEDQFVHFQPKDGEEQTLFDGANDGRPPGDTRIASLQELYGDIRTRTVGGEAPDLPTFKTGLVVRAVLAAIAEAAVQERNVSV